MGLYMLSLKKILNKLYILASLYIYIFILFYFFRKKDYKENVQKIKNECRPFQVARSILGP